MKIRTFIIALTLLIGTVIETNLKSGYIFHILTVLYIGTFILINRKRLRKFL